MNEKDLQFLSAVQALRHAIGSALGTKKKE
jgi:hypothetical protein